MNLKMNICAIAILFIGAIIGFAIGFFHGESLYLWAFDGSATVVWSALLGLGTILVAIIAVRQNKKVHGINERLLKFEEDRQKPLLSMRLEEYNDALFLFVQNTGGSVARELKLSVNSIINNGKNTELNLDKLFLKPFELYPNETVQGRVAYSGESILDSIFPSILLDVEYVINDNSEKVRYARMVTFSKYYDTKISADVNVDLSEIKDLLDTSARSLVRVANYLDGCQLAPFDKLNLLAKKSLQNDLCSAFETAKREPIRDRETTIIFALGTNIETASKQQELMPELENAPSDCEQCELE